MSGYVGDSATLPPDVHSSREDLERQTYLRTAQELSEQIASMEQQLQAAKRQRTVPSAAATADLSKQLLHAGVEQLDRALRDVTKVATLRDAQEDVASMAAFTGIEFDHVTNLLLPVSSPLTRRYTFRGRVHGLAFQITVDVRDDSFEILHLRPALSPDLTVALADFLEAVQKERALRTFFKGFSNFARAASERHAAFAAVKAKHGDAVRLPLGYLSHRLLFEGAARAGGFSFAVVWHIALDASGAVSHSVALLPRYPPELAAADRKGEVLAQVTEQFRAIVAQRGVQAAVEVAAALARAEQ